MKRKKDKKMTFQSKDLNPGFSKIHAYDLNYER